MALPVDEEKLMFTDASRVLIWSKLLAEKVQNGKNNKTSRNLGFPQYKIQSI